MELVSILMQAAAMESGLLARRLNSATAAYGGFGAICMVQNKWGSQLAVHSPYTLTDPMKSSNYEVPFSCGALASHHNYWILLFLASLWAFHIWSHVNFGHFSCVLGRPTRPTMTAPATYEGWMNGRSEPVPKESPIVLTAHIATKSRASATPIHLVDCLLPTTFESIKCESKVVVLANLSSLIIFCANVLARTPSSLFSNQSITHMLSSEKWR